MGHCMNILFRLLIITTENGQKKVEGGVQFEHATTTGRWAEPPPQRRQAAEGGHVWQNYAHFEMRWHVTPKRVGL